MKETLAEELQDRLTQIRATLEKTGVCGTVEVQVHLGAWGTTVKLEIVMPPVPMKP